MLVGLARLPVLGCSGSDILIGGVHSPERMYLHVSSLLSSLDKWREDL
jgi:hypothetical protein